VTLLVFLFSLAFALPQQKTDIDHANTLDRLCGKVVHSEPMPIKGKFYRGSMQQTSLSNIELRLYPRREDGICCEDLSPVAKTMSGEGGQFEFKKIAAGAYWLAAQFNGHGYKMPIRYQPDKIATDRCTDLMYEISDSGSFELGRIIPASH
jgi:hypothetical protein